MTQRMPVTECDADAENYDQRLWRRVVAQAFLDAESQGRTPRNLVDKQRARRWLLEPSDDFVTVCMLAGFDPQYVRQHAQRRLLPLTGGGEEVHENSGRPDILLRTREHEIGVFE